MIEYYAPLGDQGTANSTTSGVQTRPQAAALVDGGYVLVWEDRSGSPDDSSVAIRGQLFDSAGARVGAEFLVNTVTAGDQTHPSVVAMSGGGFLVTWTGSDSTGGGINGQLYTAQAVRSGGEFQVALGEGVDQGEARASASLGGFAVVWLDPSPTGTAIRGQFFANADPESGIEILVAPEAAEARSDLAITQVSDGSNNARLVVTWTQANGDGSAVMAQIIDYYGGRYGPAFAVSQTAEGSQLDAAVASYSFPENDHFVVAYVDSADEDGSGAITVRTFNATGQALSADLRLTEPGSGAHDPSVVLFGSGLFAVSWRGSDGGLLVQIVNGTGEALGEPLEISSEGELASLIRLGDESFAAVWADGDIQTRIFAPAGPAVADLILSDSKVGEAVPANLTVAELGATGIGGSGGFSFALIDDSSGAFAIEGNRLVLVDPSLIDFETAPQAQVTVRVTDSGGRTRDESFTLDIADAAVEPQGWTASDSFAVKDTPSGAGQASVAALASGGFVTVYSDYSSASSVVRGQIYSDSGEKVGVEFSLPSVSNGGFQEPLVAGLADGGFAILFGTKATPESFRHQLFTQRFDSEGNAVGDPVRVGTGADGQTGAIAALPGGGFVVAYSDAWYAVPPGENNLFGQMFDSDGAKAGEAFAIPSGSYVGSEKSTVTTLEDGGFLVVWEANGTALQAQRFDSAGQRVGTTFQVDSAANSDFAIDPSVTGLAGGGFVISWSERTPYQPGEIDPWTVKAQIFDSAGAKVGGELVVHSETVAQQQLSTVTPLAGGGFMAVWNEHDYLLDVGDSDWFGGITRAQIFDASGNKVGGEFALGEGFAQDQLGTAAATLSWGGVVVVYSDHGGSVPVPTAVLLKPGTFDAQDDSILASESSGAEGSLFADNGSGADAVPADGTPIVAEVNGSSDVVGQTITLASGALLTVNADGTFDYDTNHVFDSLAEYGTGGSNSVASDSFSYRLLGGDTAVVNLEIRGEYSAPHVVEGSAGADSLTGTANPDSLMLQAGGDDNVSAGGGNDSLFFIGALTGADIVNGGSGVDTLILQGSYAGGVTLTANVTQIENISILGGNNTAFGEPGTNRHDYVLTTNNANFAAGVQARINGAALLADEDFTFDGSAETDASYVVYGGKGVDTLTGGLGNDIFFYAEERFASGDTVNGGAGYDGMFLRGNYTINFNAPGYTGLFTNIENLTLTSATDERYARGGGTEFDYNLTLSDAIVGAGQTLTVSGALLTAGETMVLDAGQEADGFLRLFGGKANDTLKGGGQADLILGGLGADAMTGNGGADTFRFDSTAESNAYVLDRILDFTPGTDKIDLSRIDAKVNSAGEQAFMWLGSSPFTGAAGQLRLHQDGGTWYVQGDTNGDGVSDLVIALNLQGPTPLSVGDFIL